MTIEVSPHLQHLANRAADATRLSLTAAERSPKSEVIANNVPEAIRPEKRWGCWAWKRSKTKWTKRPTQPDGKAASSTDATTWTTLDAVMRGYQRSPVTAGIGFMLGGGFAGVDLDGCVDPKTGEADPYVAEVTARLESYTEISPSKTGIKILVRGAKPKGRTQSRANAAHDCECYDGGRFFTITGQRWPGTSETIEHRTEALEWFFATYIETAEKAPSRPETINIDAGGDDLEAAREALANIPATYASTYEDWVRVGIACRSVHSSALLDEWVAWSRDGRGYQGDDDCRRKWAQLPADGAVGIGTLVYLAKLSGWTPPRKVRTRSQRAEAGKRASTEAATDDTDRPEVMVTLSDGDVADQTVRHIGNLGWATPWIPDETREGIKIYCRGGHLVHAIESDDPNNRGQLVIRPLPAPLVRERLTQACELVVEKMVKGEAVTVPTRPPKWLVDAVHVRGWYSGHVRPLVGIIAAPTIRPDGSILQEPGYDNQTGLLYRPATTFPTVPESLTQEDGQAAIAELLEVVSDFPTTDDADRSVWVRLVLSMIGRACVEGCVPMFAFTANIRGAGKSLLVDAASLIAYGRPAPRQAFTRCDEEMRKVVTTVAIEGTAAGLFDNLDIQLGGAALDAALTSPEWTGRILGASRSTGDLPLRTVWSCTGNNMAFGSDVARRVLPVRLQSPLETPEDREDFRHPDLLAWVTENRPRLAVAALSVLRAYFNAVRPEQAGGQWGSFEGWSRVIRGAAVWSGAADPLPTRAADEPPARRVA